MAIIAPDRYLYSAAKKLLKHERAHEKRAFRLGDSEAKTGSQVPSDDAILQSTSIMGSTTRLDHAWPGQHIKKVQTTDTLQRLQDIFDRRARGWARVVHVDRGRDGPPACGARPAPSEAVEVAALPWFF